MIDVTIKLGNFISSDTCDKWANKAIKINILNQECHSEGWGSPVEKYCFNFMFYIMGTLCAPVH